MEILNPAQVTTLIGNSKFQFNNDTKLLCTQYAAGIKSFDSLINPESLFISSIPTNITEHSRGIEISIMYRFKLYRVALPYDKIRSVSIEDKQQVIENKEKSIVGRAFLGGMLLGPLGAVIGGMTGIRNNEKVVFSPDILLTILYSDCEGSEQAIVFTCKQPDRGKLFKLASKIFKDKLN